MHPLVIQSSRAHAVHHGQGPLGTSQFLPTPWPLPSDDRFPGGTSRPSPPPSSHGVKAAQHGPAQATEKIPFLELLGRMRSFFLLSSGERKDLSFLSDAVKQRYRPLLPWWQGDHTG